MNQIRSRRAKPAAWALGLGLCLSVLGAAATLAQDDAPLGGDPGEWIHEDIEAGYAQAKATGKPLLVAFR